MMLNYLPPSKRPAASPTAKSAGTPPLMVTTAGSRPAQPPLSTMSNGCKNTITGRAAGRMLPWHQAQPRCKISSPLEYTKVGYCRCDQGCRDWPDARDGGQPPRRFVLPRMRDNFRLECLDALGH